HLRADVGSAYLFAGADLALQRDDACKLVAELNAHFSADGLTIEAPHPQHWYLRLEARPSIETYAPSIVAGREVGAFLPAGDDGVVWRQRFNEAQMILHSSPTNEARVGAGKLPINSVWFWGAGCVDDVHLTDGRAPPARYGHVWGAHVLAHGSAALGWQSYPGEANVGALLSEGGRGAHLVLLDDCHRAVLSKDVEHWRRSLMHAEQTWFEPLSQALADGQVDRVEVRVGMAPAVQAGVPHQASGSQGEAPLAPGRGARRMPWWRSLLSGTPREFAAMLDDSEIGAYGERQRGK
ncbi:MAG: hypothetical protein ACI9W2_005141, partial [Gammaproteobacteria bacterium]